MAEITGVVLGGIPVVVWALEQYRDAVKSFWKYEESVLTLRDHLFIQREQLQLTLRRIGLTEPTFEELKECLASRYPEKQEAFLSIIGKMDAITLDLMKGLDITRDGQPMWTSTPPTRARWEWHRIKHGFKARSRKRLLEEFREWNTGLANCLGRGEIPAEDDDVKVLELQSRFNSGHFDLVRQRATSIHVAIDASLNCACSSPHRTHFKIDEKAGQSWTRNTFEIAISTWQHNPQVMSSDLWRKFHVLSEGTGESQRHVPIPSLCYVLQHSSTSNFPHPLKLQTNQGDTTVSLEHVSADSNMFIRFTSLMPVLSDRDMQTRLNISTCQRYGLAAALALMVLQAGDTPWIGDDWDHDQVKLSIEKDSVGRETLSHFPYIAYLFSANPARGSQQLNYRFQSPKILNKTIFALGVLLIELCLNQPFEELRRKSSIALANDYDFAVHKVDDVYREAGDSYGYAVQRCLKFEFSGISSSRKFSLPSFRKTFHNAVFAPVQARYLRSSRTTAH